MQPLIMTTHGCSSVGSGQAVGAPPQLDAGALRQAATSLEVAARAWGQEVCHDDGLLQGRQGLRQIPPILEDRPSEAAGLGDGLQALEQVQRLGGRAGGRQGLRQAQRQRLA